MSLYQNAAKAKAFTPRSSQDDRGLWLTQLYIYKDLPIASFRMLGDCGQNRNHDHVGNVVLQIWRW